MDFSIPLENSVNAIQFPISSLSNPLPAAQLSTCIEIPTTEMDTSLLTNDPTTKPPRPPAEFPRFLLSAKSYQDFLNNSLIDSAKKNLPKRCAMLLETGWNGYVADPRAKDRAGNTALHTAAERGYLEICRLLIQLPVLDTQNANQQTPLHLACKSGSAHTALLLVREGASLSAQDYLGNTPVHYAISQDLRDVFISMLERRPKLLQKNKVGEQALELSKSRSCIEFLGNQKSPKVPVTVDSDSDSESALFDSSLDPLDFEVLRSLGEGGFGEVVLVRHARSLELFALKSINKKLVEDEHLLACVFAERNILCFISHPFIASIHCAFQSRTKLYLAIEYCAGGDLSELLDREEALNEELAQVYLAEILLAIEALHAHDVMYRDLKPENVLICQDGHVKLTDFGLAKEGMSEGVFADSFCGSPAYLAPELLSSEQYSKEVDWYMLGLILFEMLLGMPPFFSEDNETLLHNIQYQELIVPASVSPAASRLLYGLLCKSPRDRLSPAEIKSHEFFQGVNWESVLAKELPVLPPVLKSTSQEPGRLHSASLTDEDGAKLLGWSFT